MGGASNSQSSAEPNHVSPSLISTHISPRYPSEHWLLNGEGRNEVVVVSGSFSLVDARLGPSE